MMTRDHMYKTLRNCARQYCSADILDSIFKIEIELMYNIVLVLDVQHNDLFIDIY